MTTIPMRSRAPALVAAAAFAGALALPVAARAADTVLDFDDFSNGHFYDTMNPFVEGGFTFTNDCERNALCFGVWGDQAAEYSIDPGPGHASVFANYGYTTTTMMSTDGSAFDFRSIDLADVYNVGSIVRITFTFNYAAGGSSTQSVWTDGYHGAETFTFDQHGLSSVSWANTDGSNGWNQFDNVVVSAVPEPASAAFLLAGLAGLGLVARRRR